ncbi:MAG: CIA30 family protein [Planctomycetota bacterium]
MRVLIGMVVALMMCTQARADARAMGFDEPDIASRWITVNDGVMGGRSSGGPSFSDGTMVFSGTINTNGGGFSSVRTRGHDWDFAGREGVVIRLRGDGRTYSLDIRTGAGFGRGEVSYRYSFETTDDGEWTEVAAPFSAFRPTWRGRDVTGRVADFDPGAARSLGFSQSDGADGPFRLEIDWIDTLPTRTEDAALDDAWFGTWTGTSAATLTDGSTLEFFTSLTIDPIDEGRWTFTLVYGEGAQRQVRANTLESIAGDGDRSPGAGRFVVNEQNGIELDCRLVGRGLYGRFVVGGSDIVTSYVLREGGDAMDMTLVTFSSPTDATETGGSNGVPTVRTTAPIAVQRAVLTRGG